jgi:hypothetical protein
MVVTTIGSPGGRVVLSNPNTCSSAARTDSSRSDAVVQSVALSGSLSCSPAYCGVPEHWFSRATSRTWVADVSGTSNVRKIRLGASGRGLVAGNALSGLV